MNAHLQAALMYVRFREACMRDAREAVLAIGAHEQFGTQESADSARRRLARAVREARRWNWKAVLSRRAAQRARAADSRGAKRGHPHAADAYDAAQGDDPELRERMDDLYGEEP